MRMKEEHYLYKFTPAQYHEVSRERQEIIAESVEEHDSVRASTGETKYYFYEASI